jgi:hypothetical protein
MKIAVFNYFKKFSVATENKVERRRKHYRKKLCCLIGDEESRKQRAKMVWPCRMNEGRTIKENCCDV